MARITAALACFAALATALPAAAADSWTVDPASSELTWSVSFAENALPGAFEQFSSQIAFDPADLAGSNVVVEVQIASVKTEDPEQTLELAKPDWFDAETFPTATFTASTFRSVGDETYEADGVLTIRDQAQPITLPFTFAIDGDSALIEGGTSINRLDYSVGLGDWAVDDIVGFDVAIQFRLDVTRTN